jgi:hypothetical protein
LTTLKKITAALRQIWLSIGVALVIFVILELIAGLFVKTPLEKHAKEDALKSETRALKDKPWARAHLDQYRARFLDMPWRPYVHWTMGQMSGETINTDARGLRKTWNTPPRQGATPKKVFMIGGSTIHGFGARDDFTIPSLLSKELASGGLDVVVTNLAQFTYVSYQGVITLLNELRDEDIPDVVVFYDGCNELYGMTDLGGPFWSDRMEKEFGLLTYTKRGALLKAATQSLLMSSALGEAVKPSPPWKPPSEEAQKKRNQTISRVYTKNVKLLERLALSYGFRALFYFQPILYSKAITPDETVELKRPGRINDAFIEWSTKSYQEVRDENQKALRGAPGYHDIADVLDDQSAVYIDQCHVNEAANAIIAKRMFEDVSRALSEPPKSAP